MENEEIVEVEEIPELPKVEDEDNDTTDYKAEALKYQGMAQRFKTKLQKMAEKAKEVKPEAKVDIKEPKSDELDYGQKAYLAANDIKSQDEIKIVKDIMKDTGKTLEEVLESKYFQAEIKEVREKKQTQDAIPSKTKRSSNSAKDQIDYWLNKKDSNGNYEYPEDRELRMKVIEARRKENSSGNPFRK